MAPTNYSCVRDFLLQATSSLRTATVSEFEAFHIALELLTWAKLSYTRPLPRESQIAAVRTRGIEGPLQRLWTTGLEIRLHEAFSTIIKLKDLDPALVNSLVLRAENLASSGTLDRPSIDAVMPPPTAGSVTSVVVPSELAELMIRLGGLSPGISVYTPWDFFGRLAIKASETGAFAYLESPIHSGIPRLVQILTGANIEVRYADPITSPSTTDEGHLRTFDVSLAFPPIGTRYDKSIVEPDRFGRFPEKTGSGAVLVLRHLLSQSRQRVVVAVPNSVLFSVGVERSLREDLLEKGVIRSVIAMPDGLLENTSVGFAILVLDPNGGQRQIQFVDASSTRFQDQITKTQTKLKNLQELAHLALHASENRELNAASEPAVATVSLAEIRKSDSNLQVSRHVLPESKKRQIQQLSNARKVALKDVIATVRPLPLAATKALPGTQVATCKVFEVGALDLPRFGFISNPRRRIELSIPATNEYAMQFLRPFDIVLIVKGGVGKVGIVPEGVPTVGSGIWVVGQSGIVLRANGSSQLMPAALFMFLRSPLGQILLTGIVSGATTPLIQLRELLSLEIPELSLIEQQQAIKALARESEIQVQLDKLGDEQATAAANLWTLQ